MGRARFILLAVMLLAAAPVAFSQTSQPAQATANAGDGEIHRSASGSASSTSNLSSRQQPFDTLRVVGALAGVIALIVLLRFGLKRMAPGAMGRNSRSVRVVGRTYVGPKQQILIVQVGRRVLVVGDSGQNLRTLAEITDPDEIAGLIGESLPAAAVDRQRETRAVQTPWDDAPPKSSDPGLETARSEVNGLADRVRILAKHLNRA